ncbi:putative AMP-activated kinase, glycogen-binding protein [Helianthus debilis subsp. tardiflorus]
MKCLSRAMVSFIASRLLFSPVNFKIRPVKSVRVRGCKETSGFSCEEALERELLVFMKNSRNPNEFPSRKQLLDAGRVDLVNAVANTGGWLALGWDEDENHFQGIHSSSSPTALAEEEEEDKGVEGILSRLEKHRSLSFDIHMEKNIHATYASSKDNGGFNKSTHVAANIDSQLQERQRHNNNNNKDLSPDKIRSRLQHMQLELTSAIHSLRSKTQTLNSEVHESRGSELQQLSDVWEFQENEVMKAGDKLRSMRAKLAVLEGKIALSVIDTQKLVEEKQKRIDRARTTLRLLRTICIYWTHSASEVLLVGSFDGWTSQVKMEKTRTGIFSTSLKLYPGRYEIKFIVDGIWRVDPMLPVVHNNGYENNSLIVHE